MNANTREDGETMIATTDDRTYKAGPEDPGPTKPRPTLMKEPALANWATSTVKRKEYP